MLLSKSHLSKAAAYLRLSREDGDKVESDSISGQRELIADYARTHDGIKLEGEYVDDGYSGTSFERPAFKRLIQDIDDKKIDCIIVKDLSRLGRNYIETGRYLEKIFPLLGVRFIAINDNYDSFDQNNGADNIVIPFKNLINDAYCRDISIKVRSQMEIKMKKGDCVHGFVTYGYKKDPSNKNKLIIDEEVAPVVRRIFQMKVDGYSPFTIAKKLSEDNILTPLEYKLKCGENFYCGFRSGKDPVWQPVAIYRILQDEVYTGTMVQGKTKKINYKVNQYRKVDKEDWIRVPCTHEPIISKQIFDLVQEMLRRDTRCGNYKDTLYLLSGFLHCADCGAPMIRRSVKKPNGKVYAYYDCQNNKNGNGCKSHMINEAKAVDAVLTAVQEQISLFADVDKLIAKAPDRSTFKPGLKSVTEQIDALGDEILRYSELTAKLNHDRQCELIGNDEYELLAAKFARKISSAKASLKELENKKISIQASDVTDLSWLNSFKEYRNIKTLDRRAMVTLIDRIEIFDKNHIEVRFCHDDEIREIMDWLGITPEEEKESGDCEEVSA